MNDIKLLYTDDYDVYKIPVWKEKNHIKEQLINIDSCMQILNDVKISFNFNLRKRGENKTPIYCVVKVNNRQLKIPTCLKIYPYQWDGKRQECKVMGNMIENERAYNIMANRKLYDIKCRIYDIIDYLCISKTLYVPADIEKYIRRTLQAYPSTKINMANKNAIPPKRTITATKLLKQAFDSYYKANGNQKQSTIATQETRLKKFFAYMDEANKGDSPNRLTQDGLNEYKEWLIKKANESEKTKMGAKAINQFCQLIARLINNVLCVRSEYRKYDFKMVRYVTIADTRRKDDKFKRALTDEEVNIFKDFKAQKEREQEIKDLFILQLNTGVRKGDLVRLVNGEYITDREEPEYIIVETEKEGITAVCDHLYIDNFSEKYTNGLKLNVNSSSFESTYNNGLKDIFKKCGLTKIEKYKENVAGRNVEKSAPLNKLISNHFARHTFITNKLREGMSPDKLCYMTGHADDRMIREVYEHLSKTDKIRAVKKERERISDGANVQRKVSNEDSLKSAYNSLKAQMYDRMVTDKLNEPYIKEIEDVDWVTVEEMEEMEQQALQMYGSAAIYGDDEADSII